MTTSAALPPIRPDEMLAEQHVICRDLFKIYKIADLEVVALRGLDLTVGKGEVLAIVGASGSGKSTLLNVLAGLDVPSAGQAYVNKADLLALTEQELVDYRREEVGFVWQQTGRNLIPYLNAQQNIEVPMILAGRSRKHARERALQLLQAVRLMDKRKQRPDQLSGGEQQRVSIGVALANDPPLAAGRRADRGAGHAHLGGDFPSLPQPLQPVRADGHHRHPRPRDRRPG